MPEHSTPDHSTGRITTIYCLCDDFLKAWGHRDAPQARMTTAEVMTVALAAALFGGNQERSRCFLAEHGYLPRVLSKGRFSHRLHAVPDALWRALFGLLADVHKRLNESQEYAVDSLPVPVCDNIRIRRCRLHPCPKPDKKPPKPEGFRGYVACKRRYFINPSFYGLKVHLLVTTAGLPVEVMLSPVSQADVSAFKCLPRGLPAGAHVFPDAGYLDDQERALPRCSRRRRRCIWWRPGARTAGSSCPPWVRYISKHGRKQGETVFSQIVSAFGRTLRAVTPRGFELGLPDRTGLHHHGLTRTALGLIIFIEAVRASPTLLEDRYVAKSSDVAYTRMFRRLTS